MTTVDRLVNLTLAYIEEWSIQDKEYHNEDYLERDKSGKDHSSPRARATRQPKGTKPRRLIT